MYVPNKTKDLNLSKFNMITGKIESMILIKYMPCKCKCKFNKRDVIEIKSGIMINVDVSAKNILYGKNITFGFLLRVVAKMVYIYQVLLMIQ